MDTLLGTKPKATFSTQPTISDSQQGLLDQLAGLLGGSSSTTQTATNLGNTSLTALENQAATVGAGPSTTQTGINTNATTALNNALGYTAPTVSASTITPTTVTAPHIDSTAAFKTGVVDPLTDNFLERTLPAIAGKQGGSAGGAYGSGAATARAQAGTDFNKTLAQEGALFDYTTATANQTADLKASLANQSTDLSAGIANQSTGLTAETSNQTASTNAIKAVIDALGKASGISLLPQTQTGANVALSTSTLSPYQTLINELLGAGTTSTQQTLGVGTAGSTGLLGGLLTGAGNFAGTAAGSSALASLFPSTAASGGVDAGASAIAALFAGSDRRMKEDIEEVGSVDGFPLYKFRYKGTPERRLGLMAQDVEKRLPHAVGVMPSGYKGVNYAAVLEDVLAA